MVSKDQPPRVTWVAASLHHRVNADAARSRYLQLFQQLVVVSNGSLQSLQEFLLCLQLLCHRTRPPASVSLALRRSFARCWKGPKRQHLALVCASSAWQTYVRLGPRGSVDFTRNIRPSVSPSTRSSNCILFTCETWFLSSTCHSLRFWSNCQVVTKFQWTTSTAGAEAILAHSQSNQESFLRFKIETLPYYQRVWIEIF